MFVNTVSTLSAIHYKLKKMYLSMGTKSILLIIENLSKIYVYVNLCIKGG